MSTPNTLGTPEPNLFPDDSAQVFGRLAVGRNNLVLGPPYIGKSDLLEVVQTQVTRLLPGAHSFLDGKKLVMSPAEDIDARTREMRELDGGTVLYDHADELVLDSSNARHNEAKARFWSTLLSAESKFAVVLVSQGRLAPLARLRHFGDKSVLNFTGEMEPEGAQAMLSQYFPADRVARTIDDLVRAEDLTWKAVSSVIEGRSTPSTRFAAKPPRGPTIAELQELVAAISPAAEV